MKNKNRIINELYDKSPDVRESVKNRVDLSRFGQEEKTKTSSSSSKAFKYATAALSVALVAMIAVLAPVIAKLSKKTSQGGGNIAAASTDYVVHIDVNPSVRFDVSANDVVTAQKGMNKDGVVLLYKENLVGKNIDDAATYILEKMKEAGLVKGNVRISITDKKTGKPLADKQRHAVNVVENLFGSDNISALILSDDEIDAIEDYYDKNDIGAYEKDMIKEFKTKLLVEINNKIARIDELTTILSPYKNVLRDVKDFGKTNEAEKIALEAIKVYCTDYNVNWHEVRKDSVKEFYEDLIDKKEDLAECIDDINNPDADDTYGEILADLFEIVKEELFEEDD